jgi:UPF0755 protein
MTEPRTYEHEAVYNEYDQYDQYDEGEYVYDAATGEAEPVHGRPIGRPPRTRTRAGRPRWFGWLAIVALVGLLGTGVAIVWVRHQINPGSPGAQVLVTIPSGSSTGKIASVLAKAGVIHGPSVFRLYVKLKGAGPLLAGEYSFNKNLKYDTVISILEKGPAATMRRLTIPEGFTLAQIAARVATLPHLTADKFLAAAASGQVQSPYQPPGSTNLEGLLYPATYQVQPGEDEVAVLRRMVDAFTAAAQQVGLDQAAVRLHMTPYQLITVASMVEREAKLPEDRGPIASVIYNRLKKGMKLGVDATVLYGEGVSDPHQLDLNGNTPYNTYKFHGLPPTPIASPGQPSLEAAANPPTTTYLYYVLIDPSGKHAFASTAREFDRLAAQSAARGLR